MRTKALLGLHLAVISAAFMTPRGSTYGVRLRKAKKQSPHLTRVGGVDDDDSSAETVHRRVIGAVAALSLLFAPLIPPATAQDFGGLPSSSSAKSGGLRGKKGNIAAPSESGLGLFVDKDGPSLLRLGVQDTDMNAREVQANLELIRLRLEQVGFSGKTPIWNAASADVSRAEGTLAKYAESFVAQCAPERQDEARAILNKEVIGRFPALREATKSQNFDQTMVVQGAAAEGMGQVRELMASQRVDTTGPFFSTPEEYRSLPRLEGRASVDLDLKAKAGGSRKITVVVDGFHAPLASGAFVAQAASGAFDGLPVAYSEELIVGMQRPTKGASLETPFELFYRGDSEPTYGITQDDDGRSTDTFTLPFQAFGAVGLSHPDEDIDGGRGGQFFFVKYDQSLMPPGRNTLDGAYECFGYTVSGEDALRTLAKGDVITKATVTRGIGNLRNAPK